MTNEKVPQVTEPGFVHGKPSSWRSDVNKNGKPFVSVRFDNGIWWRAWLVGEATQFAVDALVGMGFNGVDPNELNDNPHALDKTVEVGMKVDWMKSQDKSRYLKDGKPVLEATGVWPPYQKKEISPENKIILKGIDLRAFVIESKKTIKMPERKDINPQTQSPPLNQAQGQNPGEGFASDEIPF